RWLAPQRIITRRPAVGHLLTPLVKHFQALLLPCLVTHLGRYMACLAPWRITYPFLGQRQPEIEQGMLIISNVAHEDADLTVIDFAPGPTPLPVDPDRLGATLGEAARIEGENTIGLAQAMDHLRHQHLDQRTMIPWHRADEGLQDLSLNIDERGDVLGILPGQVRQQPLE